MTLFLSINDAEIFFAVFLSWILIAFFENGIILYHRQGKTKIETDKRSGLLINATALASIIIAYKSTYDGLAILPESVFYFGIASIVAGILLREWAVVILSNQYSYRVRIFENHKIIETGPYRLIRHPAYAGSILTLLGFSLVLRSGIGVLIVMLFTNAAYAYRIDIEEKALLAELGEKYSKYMRRTKQIIPFIK